MRGVMRWVAVLALGASAAPFVWGQAAPALAGLPAPCPRQPVSVYFASWETEVSPQAQALLGKIREAATACRPDRIDLVAHIDAREEGGEASALSMQRASLIAKELVAAGLPAERIRVAAQESLGAGRQIEVVFHKDELAEPGAPPAAPVPPPHAAPLAKNAI